MVNLAQIKKERLLFLSKLYEVSGGDILKIIKGYELAASINIDEIRAAQLIRYLIGEYLVKIRANRFTISITPKGVKEIEGAMANPEKETKYFPAFNIIKGKNISNSNIQHGDQNS